VSIKNITDHATIPESPWWVGGHRGQLGVDGYAFDDEANEYVGRFRISHGTVVSLAHEQDEEFTLGPALAQHIEDMKLLTIERLRTQVRGLTKERHGLMEQLETHGQVLADRDALKAENERLHADKADLQKSFDRTIDRETALIAENERLRAELHQKRNYVTPLEHEGYKAQLSTLRAAAEHLSSLAKTVPTMRSKFIRERLDAALAQTAPNEPDRHQELIEAAKRANTWLTGFVSRSDWEEPKADKVRIALAGALKKLGAL